MQPHGGGMPQQVRMPGIHNTIAVASGKGGVGKSTVAANLALALQAQNQRVGLMDADIYGPSVPIMLGVEGTFDQSILGEPPVRYGLKLMSMGFLVKPDNPMIWRGPMVAKYVGALLTQTNWGELDYLIIDMPPGTGDAQLTLTQTIMLSGAVIVTTPQEVSLIDARKGLEMFRQVRAPVLGIVENMSYFVGDDGKRYEIFLHGGGKKLAGDAKVPFLGEIPIDPQVAKCGDTGDPIVHKHPDSPVAIAYKTLAKIVVEELKKGGAMPELPTLQM